jgi:pSer/pThr/pTyr-binding forkhead associated (FHA) protein/anti-anti-sigma regulatory factor
MAPTEMLTLERDDSALLPGMFRLAITAPDEPQPTIQVVEASFALIGRTAGCTCRFDHPNVERRHAYLQSIYGRLYCIDLDSASGTFWGDTRRRGGWFDPEDVIRIGPYQIRLVDTLGLGTGSEALSSTFNPLNRYAGDVGPLPKIVLTVRGAGRHAHYTISRPITLVGTATACKLRLTDNSVSSIHCGLLWLRDGLWIIDLAGKGGTKVQGKPVRCAKLVEGDRLRIGKFSLRIHYSGELHTPAPSREREIEPIEVSEAIDMQVERASLDSERTVIGADRAEVQAMRHSLTGQWQAAEERQQMLEGREAKLAEAQLRLAAEWERLHADRAAFTAIAEDLQRRQEEFANESRRQVEEAESLDRQRREMASRASELAEARKNLKAEWTKIEAARAKASEIKQRLTAERSDLRQLKEELHRMRFEIATSEHTPQLEMDMVADPLSDDAIEIPVEIRAATPGDFDILETTRHNKVFATERSGDALVVIPLGDASEFHYGDVHTESNKVRRLLEGGSFQNLVIDFGSAPVFSAVTINVVVALSRIASNRGGQAVLCNASERTRGVLQTMKLLELWPLFANRAEALRSLADDAL